MSQRNSGTGKRGRGPTGSSNKDSSLPNTDGEQSPTQPPMKKHNSLPDLTFKTTGEATKAGHLVSINDIISNSLTNSDIVKSSILPILQDSLKSFVESAIEKAVSAATSSVISLMSDKVIKPLKADIADSKARIYSLEKKVETLSNDLENLEQYTRKNSIRLLNVPMADIDNSELNSDKLINDIFTKKLSIHFDPAEIDICHPLGKINPEKKCNFIVKFKSYDSKIKVLQARRKLAGSSIVLTEDLTKYRHDMVRSLIQARKEGHIHSFWTRDGKIYSKSKENSPPKAITNPNDIKCLLAKT